MVTNTQNGGNGIDAGLHLRTRKQIWSWSWPWSRSKKKLTHVLETEKERPWVGVAEWLRVAHSLLDGETAEPRREGFQK